MKRGQRKGIDTPVYCDLANSEIFVRGDIVSVVLTNDVEVSLPEDWGLIHDPSGKCTDQCEVFIAPYSHGRRLRNSEVQKVGRDARAYYGNGAELHEATVELPIGPWERVGDIACINYDRYGELEGPYYHDTDVPKKRSERAILFRQRQYRTLLGQRVKAFRISLPDGCKITEHGFVWP
jgi:hypothetical protein